MENDKVDTKDSAGCSAIRSNTLLENLHSERNCLIERLTKVNQKINILEKEPAFARRLQEFVGDGFYGF